MLDKQIFRGVLSLLNAKEKRPKLQCLRRFLSLVGEDGFEPSKQNATDLQSAPFGHSGTPPYFILVATLAGPFQWSWWTDLNPRPADYKSAALPTELHQRI